MRSNFGFWLWNILLEHTPTLEKIDFYGARCWLSYGTGDCGVWGKNEWKHCDMVLHTYRQKIMFGGIYLLVEWTKEGDIDPAKIMDMSLPDATFESKEFRSTTPNYLEQAHRLLSYFGCASELVLIELDLLLLENPTFIEDSFDYFP